MTEVDIAGVGIWSEKFGNWDEFQEALAGATVESAGALKPELIPARERRRAPAAARGAGGRAAPAIPADHHTSRR